MEINFTREETLKLIESYYSRLEEREVKAKVTCTKGLVGFYQNDGCVTTFTISEKIEIAGMEKDIVETISYEDLKTKLTALFELFGYEVKSLILDSGLETKYEGYGMYEHTVKVPYFNGIKVTVAKKKNHTLIKTENS